jgi:hypothetical protein
MPLDMTAEGRQARVEQVERLTRAGHSARDIAAIMSISLRSVTRNRARAGLTAGYVRAREPSEDELLAAKRMLVGGASYNEVAKSVGGFNASTWRKHWPGFGWSHAEAGRHGKTVSELARKAGVRR